MLCTFLLLRDLTRLSTESMVLQLPSKYMRFAFLLLHAVSHCEIQTHDFAY